MNEQELKTVLECVRTEDLKIKKKELNILKARILDLAEPFLDPDFWDKIKIKKNVDSLLT